MNLLTKKVSLTNDNDHTVINLLESSDEEEISQVEEAREPVVEEDNCVTLAWTDFKKSVFKNLSFEEKQLYTPPYHPKSNPDMLFMLHWRPFHPNLPGTSILDYTNHSIHWVRHHFPGMETYSVHDLYCKMVPMYGPDGSRKSNEELYGGDPNLPAHLQLAYTFVNSHDCPVVLFGRVVREWFAVEFNAVYEADKNRYIFKTNGIERTAYFLDHPEYLIRWCSNERFQHNMNIIEEIAVRHQVPVQISQKNKVQEVKPFVYKPTVMTKIARKDKQEMRVVREEQAEELRLRRRSEYLKMSAAKQAEIDEKRQASRDGCVVGGHSYAWWKKSPEERASITKSQMEGRKAKFVKHGRLPEIKQRQGERYRATVAAKTPEERQRPIEMQKAWKAGRTEEEKAVTRKRLADTVALKSEDERREAVKKMVESKARKSEADKLEQHLRTKATWASKSEEDMKAKMKKTSETIKKMSPEERKASLALTEVKKKATAAEKLRRKTLGLPELTQSEIRSRSWEKNLLQPK
ncbi:hypothetical protein BGAL_0814g00020 [Botrytis galanthina]|uniref:Uncharacterized protein n=1 Tax=Botrytis galanthina TaxID=278940 RepID=A0A4S8QR40_9HELO|nr:hypothetical protein BGAL_0814g00020 [Botrytis galanthina]